MNLSEILKKSNMNNYKIGEGSYRDVYRMDDEVSKRCFFNERVGNVCVKVLKNYSFGVFGGLKIKIPSNICTRLKFGIKDFNELEFEQYEGLRPNIPHNIKDSFAEVLGLAETNIGSALFQELVKDYDGRISKPMNKFGNIKDKYFWGRLKEIEKFFLEDEIGFFNLNPENVLVKKLGEKDFLPILIDYKRIGAKTYLFQPQLIFEKCSQKKVKKGFSRLFEKYAY